MNEPLSDLINLASGALGARAVEANDEFFAEKENLVRPEPAVFDEARFTDHGKWMDGWETRRRRTPGHDWCVVELAVPGTVQEIVVDTAHFRGNHPVACSIDARTADGTWVEILARSDLAGHSANHFRVGSGAVVEAVRLNIFPDGGVARLRVLGHPRPDWPTLAGTGETLDLASALLGAAPLDCSDRFFGEPANLLKPAPSTHMGDGWETRRRRGPGHDWVVLRLACRGRIERVVVDTSHFKGNYPASCRLEAWDSPGDETGRIGAESDWDAVPWSEVLPMQELGPDAEAAFRVAAPPATHVRFHIYPDGGVARLRLFGHREE